MIKSIKAKIPTKLLINRDFACLWIGQTISGAGDLFFDTTLILWITTVVARGQSWLALAVSGVALSVSIPKIFLGPLAGVFVDRWNKRRTLMQMDGFRALLISILLFSTGIMPLPMDLNHHLPLPIILGSIYLVIVLQTFCSLFFGPARTALIAEIVPDSERTRGMGMNNISFNIALILAPSLAALLFLIMGASLAIIIDVLSFLVSLLFVSQIRSAETHREKAPEQKEGYWSEFREGLGFLKSSQVLMMLLIAGIIFNSGAGTFNAFYLLFVLNYAHTPLQFSGFFPASYGLCVVVGSLGAILLVKRLGEGKVFWLSLLIWGASLVLFARMTMFQPALLINCLLGICNAGVNVVVGPLIMRFTKREYLGRVSAIFTPMIEAAQFVSILVAGLLASTVLVNMHMRIAGLVFRPVDTILSGAGLIAILAGVYTFVAWRKVDLKPVNKREA